MESASSVYEGAMHTSKKILFISSAVTSSISVLEMSTPPKADTGSPARAASHASRTLERDAMPQALLCLRIANVVSSKSPIKFTAASISSKLLYEISLP